MIQNVIFAVFDFLAESLKAYQTSVKDCYSFYNIAWLKKPHSFNKLWLTRHYKKFTPATQLKVLSTFYIFQQTCFWLMSERNISTALFLDAHELDSQSTWKANVSIFLQIYVRKFLFQRRSKLLSGVEVRAE